MASKELIELWEDVVLLLRTAQSRLTGGAHSPEVDALILEADRYLDHNELGLALDALVEAGKLGSPNGKFWSGLAQAAKRMDLPEKVDELDAIWADEASRGLRVSMKRDRE